MPNDGGLHDERLPSTELVNNEGLKLSANDGRNVKL
jgi:hypothetical protein